MRCQITEQKRCLKSKIGYMQKALTWKKMNIADLLNSPQEEEQFLLNLKKRLRDRVRSLPKTTLIKGEELSLLGSMRFLTDSSTSLSTLFVVGSFRGSFPLISNKSIGIYISRKVEDITNKLLLEMLRELGISHSTVELDDSGIKRIKAKILNTMYGTSLSKYSIKMSKLVWTQVLNPEIACLAQRAAGYHASSRDYDLIKSNVKAAEYLLENYPGALVNFLRHTTKSYLDADHAIEFFEQGLKNYLGKTEMEEVIKLPPNYVRYVIGRTWFRSNKRLHIYKNSTHFSVFKYLAKQDWVYHADFFPLISATPAGSRPMRWVEELKKFNQLVSIYQTYEDIACLNKIGQWFEKNYGKSAGTDLFNKFIDFKLEKYKNAAA